MDQVGIGAIRCGNISMACPAAMKSRPIFDIRGIAGLDRDLAAAAPFSESFIDGRIGR
jgi:hypothetical protein